MPSVSDAFPELFSQDDSLTPREVQTDASPTLINFGNALGRGIASAVQSLPGAPRAIDRAFPEITPQKPNPTDFLDDAVRADRFTNYNKGVIGNDYSPYRYEQLGDTPDNFYDAAVENAKTKWKSLYPDTPWGATQDNYIRQKALAYDMAHRFATTGDRGQMQMRGAIGRMNDEQRALFEQSLQEVADWQKETKTDRMGNVGAQQPNDTFLGQAAERLDKSIVRGIQDNWNAWGDSKSKEAGYQLAKNRRVTDAAQPQAGPNITGNKTWGEFAANAPRAGALAAVSQIPDLALSTSAMAASNAVLPGSGQLTGMAYWYNRLYPEAYSTMRDAGFKPGTAEATAHGTAVINGAIEMFNDIVPVPGMDDPTNKVIAKTWREWIKNNAIDIGKRFGKEWGEEAAQAVTEEAVKRVAQVIEPDVPLDSREQLGKIATQVVEAGLTLPWMAAGGNIQGVAQSAAQTQAKISADKTRLGRQQGVNDLVASTDYVQGWMQRSPEQAAAMAQTDTPSRSQWEAAGLPKGVNGTQRKAFADAVRGQLNRDTNPDIVSQPGQTQPEAATNPATNPAEMAGSAPNPAITGQAPPDPRWKTKEQYQGEQAAAQQQAAAAAAADTAPLASDPTPADVAETMPGVQLGPVQDATRAVDAQAPLPNEQAAPEPAKPAYEYNPIDVNSDFSDRTFYHGTKANIKSLKEAEPTIYGSIKNLLGNGLYLTDSEEIAGGYQKARKGEGEGKILRTKLDNVKLLDFEKPLPDDAFAEVTGIMGKDAKELRGKSGVEVFEALKDFMQDNDYYSSDAAEVYQNIASGLQIAGYDGLLHQGGKRTKLGQKHGPHNVVVLFDTHISDREGNPVGRSLADKLIPQDDATATTPPPPTKLGKKLSDSEIAAIREDEQRKALTAAQNEPAPKAADLVPPTERDLRPGDVKLIDESPASTTARQAADAAQAEFEREAQAGPQPSAFAAGPTAVPPRPRNNTIPAAVQADNPEVERQLQDASGVSKDGLLKRLAGAVPQALKMATRAQEHIPNTPKWAADNEAFRLLKTIANTSQDEANRDIAAITDKLGPQPLQLFSRKVIIDNLYESVQRGEPLRFGFDSITEVKQYKDKLDALASSSPEVQDAIDTRKKIVKELAQDLVDMGLLDEKAIERADTYYHQQVLSKFEASRNHAGAGPKETKRGFQKSRVEGVEKFDEDLNYNTSYIEAEFEWMRDAHSQLRLEKWIRDLAKRHDIIEDVKKAAKDSGEDWRRMVRESGTHKIWQAEPGNVFYPAVGIDEQVVADVLAGLTDTAEIGLDDLRSLIVLGGKRREMVLPNEIVDQLNAVQERSKTGQIGRVVRDIGNYWKVWTLLNPIKAVGYNLRNVTGDLDPVMGGAIGVLQTKYFGKSFGELRDYYGILKQQKLSLSPELQVARDLGVIDSSMTSDIPDLEDLEVFKRFYTGQSKSLLDYGKLYFDKIKKYSTFRENLSRYAAFLYYRDALKEGTLAHYGGARKAIVDQLVKDMGVDVAAAHLSRNLLGDYGDLTVMGNWLRAYAMPFYSWTEVNLKRYPRIIYNAGMYGPRKFGKSPAAVAASVAAVGMVAVPYIIMQAYNNLVWGDEEDKLSDDERASPHLILGKNDDGSLIILRNTGALGDFLEWFGVNTAVSRLDEINAGQMGYGDVIAESAKQDVNKVASGIRPDIKAFYEMSSGNSTFPDVFNPRKQRRDDMAAGYLGLTDYYRGLRGAVLQDGSRMRKYQVERMLGVTDPRRNALFEISELRDRYLKKLGSSGGFMPNLYFSNMRDAAMNGDIEAFKEARLKWLTDGDSPGDYEKFKERLKGLDPLSQKMNNEKENDFVDNYLSSAQRDKLRMARDYAGQMQVEMWKMWNQSALDDTGEVKAKINEQRVKEATSKARALLANDEPKTLSATDKKEGITLGVKKQAIRDAATEARDWIKDSGLDKSEVEDAVWAWIKDDLSTDKGRLAKMRQFQKKMGWSEWTRGK